MERGWAHSRTYMSLTCTAYVPFFSSLFPLFLRSCVTQQNGAGLGEFAHAYVPYMYRMDALYVPHMCLICPAYVPYMSRICALYVPHMCLICPAHVPYMSRTCALYVPHMCLICPAYVAGDAKERSGGGRVHAAQLRAPELAVALLPPY
jgi:hypothetical protein